VKDLNLNHKVWEVTFKCLRLKAEPQRLDLKYNQTPKGFIGVWNFGKIIF